MPITYKIKQSIKTINKGWQEIVFETTSQRVANLSFKDLVKENPDEHFELIKITHTEVALDWSSKPK